MTNENTQHYNTASNTAANTEGGSSSNRPDYVAVQYRMTRMGDGWKRRKSNIGAGWNTDKGAISVRFSGVQVIDGDFYLYPANDNKADSNQAAA
ncbi:MAG: hypothetical protein ACRBBR_06605 [Cellvibrionaceae bacterium]